MLGSEPSRSGRQHGEKVTVTSDIATAPQLGAVVDDAADPCADHRSRSLMGTFGRIEIEVPRARLNGPGGKTTEWNSQVLRAYQRRTLAADALIASAYLAGTNTRRVCAASATIFTASGDSSLGPAVGCEQPRNEHS
jgi:hypothetical protein